MSTQDTQAQQAQAEPASTAPESRRAKLAPCPFCGRRPVFKVRPDNIEASSYFAAVACYCDGYSACAHKDATAADADEAERLAREKWNSRASPAHAVEAAPVQQAQGVPTDAQILTACEEAGLWPNTAATWVANGAFARYHAAINRMLAAAPQAEPAPEAHDNTAALCRDLAKAHDSANGFIDEIKMLKQEVRELKAFRAMVNRYRPDFPADPDGPRDVWYWQGDHMDHLESMVHTLPVVIRAEQLRELLASYAPQAEPQPEREHPQYRAGWNDAMDSMTRAMLRSGGIGTKPDPLQFVQLPDGDWDIAAPGTKGGSKL